MGTTPLTGARFPDSGGAFVPDQDIHNALLDLEDNAVPRFTSTSVRDSAYAAWQTATGNSLADGMYCHVSSSGVRYRYDSSQGGWVVDGGRPQFQTLTITSSGWGSYSGHTPRGYQAAGRVFFQGWFTNTGTFTVDTTQTPIQIPAALPNPGTDQVLLLPYATPSSGEALIVATLRSTGYLRLDYNMNGPSVIPVGTHFFLDGLSYSPTYAG